jgi:two-component system, cell cycle sensor histidine kinase and response regulator CckA
MSKGKPTYQELERRCKEAEAELAGTLQNMSEGFFALDESLLMTCFNASASNHLGRKAVDVVGKHLFHTFPELQGSIFETTFREVMRTGLPFDAETYVDVHPYQNWYQVRAYPRDKGVSVYFQVTTERRRVEEALRNSQERLHQIFEASPAGIFLVDPDGFITFANRSMGELFSQPATDLIGTPYIDLVHPSQRSIGYEKMRKLMAAKSDNVSLERRYIARDGREFIGHLSGRRLLRADGSLDGLVGIITDITDRKHAEEALVASEQRYRGVFDNAAIGIDIVDAEGRIQQVNRALARMLGYEELELLNMSVFDFTYGDDVQTSRIRLQGMHERKTGSYRFEKRYVKKNGDVFWADVSVSPVRGTDGEHVATVGVIADITDRHKAEEDLRESERKYRDLFEGAPVGIFQSTTDGRVLDVNPAYARMFGYASPGEVMTRIDDVARDIYVEPERRKMLIDKALETRAFVKAENLYRKKDGSTFWGHLYFRVVRDRRGQVKHLEGFVEDINDRKIAELALEASEEKYRRLFDSSPLGLLSVDTEGSIVEVNQALLDILGSESKAATKAVNVLEFPQLLESGISDMFRFCITKGEPVQKEVLYLSSWGKQTFARILLTPLIDEEETVKGCQAIVEDISQQKRIEDQLRHAQKMEAIGTLAGGIAHDFNNLLQIILGNAELLDMELAERNLSFSELDAMREAGRRGSELVKQILMFSRRADTTFASVNLNDEVRNAQRLLSRTIPRMVEIVLKLEQGLKPIRVDCTQIEQLLINLAVNAKDAMPNGGTLTIETGNVFLERPHMHGYDDLDPGQYVLLRVADTGRGMAPEVQQHIFEPFFTTKGLADGTGLGLATAFGIVKMHGGHITCSSQVGQGTTFDMYFPAAQADATGIETEKTSLAPAGGKETILLVDDEELIRELAQRILEKSGYSVLAAGNGKEALEIYRRHQSDIALVILDLIMPEMGGKQCLEELLKIDSRVRALIASGFAVDNDTKAWLDAKAKGTVSKPFRMQELLRSVRHVLDEGVC